MSSATRADTQNVPDYVQEFKMHKPKGTEVKKINGHYYLYERCSVYNKSDGRPEKASGGMLGTITPEGLVPCKRRKPRGKGMTRFEKHMERVNPERLSESLEEKLARLSTQTPVIQSGGGTAAAQPVYAHGGAETEAEDHPEDDADNQMNPTDSENTVAGEQVNSGEHDDTAGGSQENSSSCSESNADLADEATKMDASIEHEAVEHEAVEDVGQVGTVCDEATKNVVETDLRHVIVVEDQCDVVGNNTRSVVPNEVADTIDAIGVELRDLIPAARNAMVPPNKANDDVEIGASFYLISRTKEMRENLNLNSRVSL